MRNFKVFLTVGTETRDYDAKNCMTLREAVKKIAEEEGLKFDLFEFITHVVSEPAK